MNFFKFFLFLFGVTLSSAQNFQIKGIVEDFHDKSPLENASVQIGLFQTKTNAKGQFSISNIPAGKQLIVVKHKDCEDYESEINLQENLQLKLTLEHHFSEIETVTVHRKHKDNGVMVVSTISKKELNRNSTENLGNLLSELSGVSALKTGNNISKPIIHGLYGDRVSIINNGVKLADQEWGAEHAPNVDANNFEHIDVVKGASTLKYGMNAGGGVIVMEPEIFPKKDTLKGKISLSGISNGKGISTEFNLTKTWENNWAIKTHGGYQKLGDLASPNYNLMNTGKEMNSFGFTLQNNSFMQGFSFDYYLTNQKIGIFRGSDLGNLNDFYSAIASEKPIYTRDFSYAIENPRQEIQHHIAKISAFKRVENLGKISADYSFQYNKRQEYDVRRGDLYNIPAMELELFTNQFNLNDFLERENWSLDTGFQGQYQYNYSPTSTQAKRLIPNYNQYNLGVYSVFKYQFSPIVQMEVGARWDYQKSMVKAWWDAKDWEERYAQDFSEFFVETDGNRIFTKPNLNYRNLGFNLGLNWMFSKNQKLKINFSNTERNPNIAELFAGGLHHSAAMIEVGDMRLKKENTQQLQLVYDAKWNILQGLNFTVNPYYSSINNFITQIPTGIQNTIRGVFPVWSYQQVNAELFGVDADVNWELYHGIKWISRLSYLYGQDKTNAQPLILMMPTQWTNALEFNFPWKKAYFKIENQLVARQNRFPIYNPTIKIFENGVEVEKILDLSTPPPSYQLWNMQAGLDLGANFSFGVKVSNLFQTEYKNYLNRLRFFSYDLGRNITLTAQYTF